MLSVCMSQNWLLFFRFSLISLVKPIISSNGVHQTTLQNVKLNEPIQIFYEPNMLLFGEPI